MQDFINKIKAKAENIAGEYNVSVYSVTFHNESQGRVLRVNLDGSVTLDICTAVSKGLSSWLDSMDEGFIPYKKYSLEVSSLGIDRPLKNEKDFKPYISKICKIQTKEKDSSGRKRYKGVIKSIDEESVTIFSDEENAVFTIDYKNIQKAQLEIEI